MNNAFVQPAFAGGVVMGVLSALPLISAGNICCCLWVIVGGMSLGTLLTLFVLPALYAALPARRAKPAMEASLPAPAE